ncbi:MULTISPECIES: hypothetical protein [Nocardiopsis]|uniref:hypothetical protein n=1 Tax=Nocardiopsis TaxID=2013 RepID=UPI00034BE1DE|nr:MULTISPECIES: hypothetical protein [Nocardiopsis]
MFEFARNSAKAVLVAAGAAGFAALGAGAAAAAPAPQALSPLTDAAPLVASAALAPVTAPLAAGEVPDMARTAPAPDTRNLALAGHDASGAGGAVDQGMTALDGAVDQALGQGAAGPQRQSAPLAGGAGHPAKGVNGLVHGTANSVPRGNPAPGAGGAVRDTADTVTDMVVVAEQDDVRTMSAEQGVAGGLAGTAEGPVREVLPNTAGELDAMSEEPPVSVDEGAVGDTLAGGLPTEGLAAEELPAPASLPETGLPTGAVPSDGLPSDALATDSLNADVTDGLAVGPELPGTDALPEVPLG